MVESKSRRSILCLNQPRDSQSERSLQKNAARPWRRVKSRNLKEIWTNYVDFLLAKLFNLYKYNGKRLFVIYLFEYIVD